MDIASYRNNWLFNYITNISIKNKFIFMDNPKTGSTFIKKVLIEHEVESFKQLYNVNYHPSPFQSPFIKPFQLKENDLREILENPEYKKFTCIRNPYSRILSCFLGNISNNTKQREIICKLMGKTLEYKWSFGEFVDFVCKQIPQEHDHHWRMQTALVCFDDFLFDYILHFENLHVEFVELNKLYFNNSLKISRDDQKGVVTNASSRLKEYYNNELACKVFNLYKDDFKKLGYPGELIGLNESILYHY